ncbi:hypothetical protein TanjilG_17872 [Lupinus angustifolius]|uniref:Uncharacterized protein n=1 Tax=Lupinus angustifolius TaxID=3871 RepID=A0A4P1QQ05_LUPAN|nr:PREDICTED: uncharacterized protein LOC109334119 [Lupinus angustifolius]OIV91880.1 hypothetical protein TanjilG_17872 [Lupinus angustifolius]
MEQEKKKRAREDKGGNEIVGFSFETNNNAKKRDLVISFMKDNEEDFWDSNVNLAFGVFDFPWLKDGVISKSEKLEGFEDNFMTSLRGYGIELFDENHYLCETLEVSMSPILESKVVEDLWKPFQINNSLELEDEDVNNCTWNSLFNHPL